MNASIVSSRIDVSALSWCLPEIQTALEKAVHCVRLQLQASRNLEGDPEAAERSQLRAAQSALHQAHGALAVVDISGLSKLTEEAERLLNSVAEGTLELDDALLAAFTAAFAALVEYCENLIDGAVHQPVMLFAYLRDLKALRNAERNHPADLFFPDLSVRAPRMPEPALALKEGEAALVRGQFEQGLLRYLRDSTDASGRSDMLLAVARIEHAQRESIGHAFWWVTLAFFDAMQDSAIASDAYSKRLVARLNLQVRKTLEQATTPPDQLLVDTLFQIARASNASPFVAQVIDMYGIVDSVPVNFDQATFGRQSAKSVALFKESHGEAKLAWDRYTRGHPEALEEFVANCHSMQGHAEEFGANGVAHLCEVLAQLTTVSAQEQTLSEQLSLEIATSLLFVEEAFAKRSRVDRDYESRAQDMAQRLRQVAQGTAPEQMPQWLAQLSNAAQERQTASVFVGEMLSNLRAVEKTLDAFFRDTKDVEGLTLVDKLMAQTAGALSLLGHSAASRGAQTIASDVAQFEAGKDPEAAVASRIAESLSALSFFVESIGNADMQAIGCEFDEVEGIFRIRHRAKNISAKITDAPDVVGLPIAPPIETVLPGVPELFSVESAPTPDVVESAPHSEAKANDEAPDSLFALDLPSLAPVKLLDDQEDSVVSSLPDSGVTELKAIPQLSDSEIDAELMEIFLGEAQEVLENITLARAELEKSPGNQEQLTTVRRGFHTLKGSGRMVGLNAFGEAAWGLEQTFNMWMSEQRAATHELLALVDLACEQFTVWVAQLTIEPRTSIAPEMLVESARRLRDGEPLELASLPMVSEALLVPATQEPVVADISPVSEEFLFDIDAEAEAGALDIALSLDDDEGEQQVELVSNLFDDAGLAEVKLDLAAFEGVQELESVSDSEIFYPAPDEAFVEQEDALFEPEHVASLVPIAELVPTPVLERPVAEQVPEALAPVAFAPIVLSAGLAASAVMMTAPATAAMAPPVPAPVVTNPLFQIFIAEGDDLVKSLRLEVVEFKNDPQHLARERAVRAAHSLGGSSLVVGLPQVSAISYSLEKWMVGQRRFKQVPNPGEVQVLDMLVDRISGMLHQFAAGTPAGDESETVTIAREMSAPYEFDDSEHGHAFTAQADEQVVDALAFDEETSQDWVDEISAHHDALPAAQEDSEEVEAPVTSHRFVDDLDPELTQIFVEEAADYLPAIGADLRQWELTPNDSSLPASLMRALHTVKGGARMAGAMQLGEAVHEMETRIEAVAHLSRIPTDVIPQLVVEYDRVLVMYEAVRDPSKAAVVDAPVAMAVPASADNLISPTSNIQYSIPLAIAPAAPAPAQAQQLIRVRADLLDRMVNEAGEVSIARSRMENEIFAIKTSLNDLTENVQRLRSQLREIEIQAESQIQAKVHTQGAAAAFDPLEFDRFTRFQELTRMMAESVNDVATVQHNLSKSLNEATADLTRQSQVTRDLQQNLMRVRMVQFGSISDRLYRVVRQAGKDAGKRVNLDIRGTAAEIDRSVLERMASPLEHLLRNAVGHGIESADRRVITGKSETGEITVEVRQEGNEVVLSLADDGAGLDFVRIRERAQANGLVTESARLTDSELSELIFMPGFSTATEVTALSGRGVGMDVVRSEVAALGGRIETTSELGKGTRFVIHLPLTLAVTQVVVVTVADQKFAVPSVLVEQVMQLKPQALAQVYEQRSIERHGKRIPCDYLGNLLDLPEASPLAQRYSPLLVLRSGSSHAVVHVDTIVGNQEVVVKNLGPQLSRLQGVAGATVLGNGEIVLILNPVQIFNGANYQSLVSASIARRGENANKLAQLETLPTVMVVDDSLTVRKVSQRLLTRERYQVLLAKDGVDALRQLQDVVPDVMLVDIEMPRMDGFDLTRNVRADERLKHIPIIMITSRTADKHRNHALSLGVNTFMGKPFAEDELLGNLKQLLTDKNKRSAA